METPDALFVEMCAVAGDRGTEGIDASVERLLEGAPLAVRWHDIAGLLVRLVDQIANGDTSVRQIVAERLVEVTDGFGEGHVRTFQAAIATCTNVDVDREESVLHALRGCEMLVCWSNIVARAERCDGGDPIRWCVGRNTPAHWLRRVTNLVR